MAALRLREAVAADAQTLSAIATRTFVDTFGHLYAPEDLRTFLETAYEVETMRKEIEDPDKYTVFLFHESRPQKPCGYAMLHVGSVRTGDDGPRDAYLELKRFYIDKEFHGQGCAYTMMDHLMGVIKSKQRKIVWLGVWENNPRAQKFYNKYGFVETGEHIFYVGTAKDRDLLFTLKQD